MPPTEMVSPSVGRRTKPILHKLEVARRAEAASYVARVRVEEHQHQM